MQHSPCFHPTKALVPILLVLSLTLAAFSCGEEDSQATAETDNPTLSYQQWQAGKEQHGNSYQYTVAFGSWAGFGSHTTITVKEGQVIGRTYEYYETDGATGTRTITNSWVEAQTNLNTHPEGAEAATLDVIYQQCTEQWLQVDTAQNQLYFEGKHSGILSLCGYNPVGCMDDCFTGIRISAFQWLK